MSAIKIALVVQRCIAGHYENNLYSCLNHIHMAVEMGARVVVFPEMNLTGYTTGPKINQIAKKIDSTLLGQFNNIAVTHRTTLLVGIAEKAEQDIYASHLVFTPSGYQGLYRKIHTAPYEKKFFSSGNEIPIFESHGLKFGIQLCYDAHFPELSLAMALKKTDIIFIPHASPRGTAQEKYESWVRHLRARAFDNGIFIAACNQVGFNGHLSFPGVSLLIGPDGNVISTLLVKKQDIHIIDVDISAIHNVRSHKMKYFIPNRRADLFPF